MRINIIIDDGKIEENNNPETVSILGAKVHNNLRGNQDYIDSAILLNMDNNPMNPKSKTAELTLAIGLQDCIDPHKALDLLESSVKIMREKLTEELQA